MSTTPIGAPAIAVSPHTSARAAIIAIVLVAANLRASTAGVGSVLPDIVAETGWPAAVASGLVVLPLLLFAAVSPLAPAVARALGIDRAVALAMLVVAVGIAVRSITGAPGLWIGTALLGAGIAILNVLTPALVKRDFPQRVGTMTSIYTAVQGIAAVVGVVAVAAVLIIDAHAWRMALMAPVVLAAAATITLFSRPYRTVRAEAPGLSRTRSRLGSPWRRPLAWGLALFMGMQSTVYYVLMTWMPAIEQGHGATAAAASFNQAALQGASVISIALGVPLLRRGPDQRLLALASTGLMGVGVLGMLLAPGNSLVWAIIIGAAGGLTLVTALTLFGLRTHDANETQSVSSMGQSFGYLVAAISPILAGIVHDVTGSWTGPLIGLLALLVLQGVAGLLAAAPGSVWRHTKAD